MKWKNIQNGFEGVIERMHCASPYEVLGVSETATQEEIKNAYRKKMAVTHPDKSSDFMISTDTELAKLINVAYEKLTKRKT